MAVLEEKYDEKAVNDMYIGGWDAAGEFLGIGRLKARVLCRVV